MKQTIFKELLKILQTIFFQSYSLVEIVETQQTFLILSIVPLIEYCCHFLQLPGTVIKIIKRQIIH